MSAYDITAPRTHFSLAGKLFDDYCTWRHQKGVSAVTQPQMAEQLRAYEKVRTKQGWRYIGLKLIDEAGPGTDISSIPKVTK